MSAESRVRLARAEIECASLRAENVRLRAELVDAAEPHLADEQSIRNMEKHIAYVEAQRDSVRAEVSQWKDKFCEVVKAKQTVVAENERMRATLAESEEARTTVERAGWERIGQLTADLARVTAERDALLAAAKDVLAVATVLECHGPDCACHECVSLRALRAAISACEERTA